MARYTYHTKTHSYTSDDGDVSERVMHDLRDDFIDGQKGWSEVFAQLLISGTTTIQQWVKLMRAQIKKLYIAQFLMGAGGTDAKPLDFKAIARAIKDQYVYLNGFARDIAAGKLTPEQIVARSNLYTESSRQAFHTGRQGSWHISLPAMPGDGQTICKTNCQCMWIISGDVEQIEATWRLRAGSETCDDCIANSERWSPLVFPRVSVIE